MKARPRSVEREVAKHLTDFFLTIGCSPVERIPILGRTGPDITINEFKLVIDVKSRLEVPKMYFIHDDFILDFPDGLLGVRLENMHLLAAPLTKIRCSNFSSVLVRRWYDHMNEWTQEEVPDGINALVLHRPKMPIGKSLLIISKLNRRRFIEWTPTQP